MSCCMSFINSNMRSFWRMLIIMWVLRCVFACIHLWSSLRTTALTDPFGWVHARIKTVSLPLCSLSVLFSSVFFPKLSPLIFSSYSPFLLILTYSRLFPCFIPLTHFLCFSPFMNIFALCRSNGKCFFCCLSDHVPKTSLHCTVHLYAPPQWSWKRNFAVHVLHFAILEEQNLFIMRVI